MKAWVKTIEEGLMPDVEGEGSSGHVTRGCRLLNGGMGLLAVGVLGLLLIRAWSDVDTHWDTWGYHLPFAARLVGLVPPEQFVMSPYYDSRFEGYPHLVHLLQGVVWKLTGRIQATNLVSWASLGGFILYVRRVFRLPLAMVTFGLLSVPMVLIHSTISYSDLLANVGLAVAVLSMLRWGLRLYGVMPWAGTGQQDLLGFFLGGLIATYSKLLMTPVMGALLMVLGVLGLIKVFPATIKRDLSLASVRAIKATVLRGVGCGAKYGLIGLVALGALFGNSVINMARAGAAYRFNPFFPLSFSVMGMQWPGLEASPVVQHVLPRWKQWTLSVLEWGQAPFNWSADGCHWQFGVYQCHYTGGYFGAYMVFLVVCLGGLAIWSRDRLGLGVLLCLGVLTVLIANVPQSYELRYLMAWPMVLVVLVEVAVVYLLWPRVPPAKRVWVSTACVGGMMGWFFGVTHVTAAQFLWPHPGDVHQVAVAYPFEPFKAHVLDQPDFQGRVCLPDMWQRFPLEFYYTHYFHPEVKQPYTVTMVPCRPKDPVVSRNDWASWPVEAP